MKEEEEEERALGNADGKGGGEVGGRRYKTEPTGEVAQTAVAEQKGCQERSGREHVWGS